MKRWISLSLILCLLLACVVPGVVFASETGVTILWDGDLEGKEIITASSAKYVRVSTRVFTYSELAGLTIGSGSNKYNTKISYNENNGCIQFGNSVWALTGKAGTYVFGGNSYTLPSDGTYFIWYSTNRYTDYLYLPNAIGDSGVIASPTQPTVADTPTIIIDLPSDPITYTAGSPAAPLSVSASVSDGGTLSYEWRGWSDNDTLNGDIVGTESSYTPDTSVPGTYTYSCTITNTTGSGIDGVANSATATVIVTAPAPTDPDDSGGSGSSGTPGGDSDDDVPILTDIFNALKQGLLDIQSWFKEQAEAIATWGQSIVDAIGSAFSTDQDPSQFREDLDSALDDLGVASDAMDAIERPDLGSIDLNIGAMMPIEGVIFLSSAFTDIMAFDGMAQLMIITAGLGLIAFLIFGRH